MSPTADDLQFAKQLSSFAPINGLNPDCLQQLALKAKKIRASKGTTLCKAGQKDGTHLFLLGGEVTLTDNNGRSSLIKAGTTEASMALANHQPRTHSIQAHTDVVVVQVSSELLDIMLTWDQTGSYEVRELQKASQQTASDDAGDWMTQILQTKAFHRIPPANIQAMFMRLEAVSYKPGAVVVQQGADGDYFYLIKSGRCMVTRAASDKSPATQLAELGPGDSFGEEALISSDKRNATVTMLTSGTMMRLSKVDFISLLNEPLLSWVDYAKTEQLLRDGAVSIDVRLPSEYENSHLKGSINIPLIFLRMKLNSLDTSKQYLVYCDTGRRSSAASFLLGERGFDVFILQEGIHAIPGELLESGKPPR